MVKNYQEQVRILEQLERVDNKNHLLKHYNVKDIVTKMQEATDTQKEFQAKFLNKASVFI